MIEGSLSRRYTKALFELAREGGREEAVGEEIDRFLSVYRGTPLQNVLNNPAFEIGRRRRILLEVGKSLQLSSLTVNFLALLLERDRLAYLPSMVASYRRLLNAARGRVEATVRASAPLSAGLLERLSERLSRLCGKQVILHERTDPELIGGLVVEMEGTVYDGSVRNQLEKMKQRIARGY
ncbi:MAG TPA: ATP synthase F1 subunit delta [candidate division Zixibacteria bacterium]|nr:ATP synthase F1 subunit delta [candidate division Zixibacteria bacterium]